MAKTATAGRRPPLLYDTTLCTPSPPLFPLFILISPSSLHHRPLCQRCAISLLMRRTRSSSGFPCQLLPSCGRSGNDSPSTPPSTRYEDTDKPAAHFLSKQLASQPKRKRKIHSPHTGQTSRPQLSPRRSPRSDFTKPISIAQTSSYPLLLSANYTKIGSLEVISLQPPPPPHFSFTQPPPSGLTQGRDRCFRLSTSRKL